MMNLLAITASLAVVSFGWTEASPLASPAQVSDVSFTIRPSPVLASAWADAGSLLTTPPVTLESEWQWDCPRRGTVSKTFKWRGWVQDDVVNLQPLDNVDFFDNFRSFGPRFTSLFHHNYCVQEKTFNCLYKVTGCTVGQMRGRFLSLDLVRGDFAEKPKVEEACVETSSPFPAGKCPVVPDTAYKSCTMKSATAHAI